MKKSIKILSLIIAIAVGTLMSTACGVNPQKDAADGLLKAVKSQDAKTIAELYAGKVTDLELESIAQAFTIGDIELDKSQKKVLAAFGNKLKDFDYKITDVKKEGGKATVKVTFVTYDFGPVLKATVSDFKKNTMNSALSGGRVSEKIMTATAVDALARESANPKEKKRTVTVTLKLKRSRGKWKVLPLSDKAIDAVYGGLLSSAKNIEYQIESRNEE